MANFADFLFGRKALAGAAQQGQPPAPQGQPQVVPNYVQDQIARDAAARQAAQAAAAKQPTPGSPLPATPPVDRYKPKPISPPKIGSGQ